MDFSCIIEILNVKVWSTLIRMSLKNESTQQKVEWSEAVPGKKNEEEEEETALR